MIKDKEKVCIVRCEPIFDKAAVTKLYPLLLQAVLDNQSVQFDAGEVKHITLAGIQLLLSWANTVAMLDKSMVWLTVSPSLQQYVSLLGLSERLALTESGLKQ